VPDDAGGFVWEDRDATVVCHCCHVTMFFHAGGGMRIEAEARVDVESNHFVDRDRTSAADGHGYGFEYSDTVWAWAHEYGWMMDG